MDWGIILGAAGFGLALAGAFAKILQLALEPIKADLGAVKAKCEFIKTDADLVRLVRTEIAEHKEDCAGATVKTNGKTRRVRAAVLAICAGVLVLAASGCVSTITPVRDESGRVIRLDSYKIPFSPDLSYSAEWDELASDGKTLLHRKESYSSQTAADRIAGALGSLAEIYSKVKP